MIVRLVSEHAVYRLFGWTTPALLLLLVACAPAPPVPPAPPTTIPARVTPTADARALEVVARRDAQERLWATIALRPEVIPGGPTFAGGGPDASRVLSGIGCQFAVLNTDVVERRFGGPRLTVEVTTRISGQPVTNAYSLSTSGFSVPAGGAALIGPAQLPVNDAGWFDYQFGDPGVGESWGRVYRGPLASKEAFVSVDVPDVTLTVIDPSLGPSNKDFPVTGCQLRA